MTQFGEYAKSVTGSQGRAFRSHGCWGYGLHSGMATRMMSELYTDCTVALPRKWATAHELMCGYELRPQIRWA